MPRPAQFVGQMGRSSVALFVLLDGSLGADQLVLALPRRGVGDEIDEQLAETAAWIEEFNDALDDAREHLTTFHGLANEAPIRQA